MQHLVFIQRRKAFIHRFFKIVTAKATPVRIQVVYEPFVRSSERKKTDASRLENLLFYLEHGYQKVEWDNSAFNLTEELDWAVLQQALHAEGVVSLCMRKDHALCRLLWQTNDDNTLIRLYTDLLSMSSLSS